MKSQLLHETAPRVFVLVFEPGDEVTAELTRFAAEKHLKACGVYGLGTFEEATLGYFDLQAKDYRPIPVREQVEVASLVGNIAMLNGGHRLHAHVVIGKADGTAMAGHLLNGRVRPTLELLVTEYAGRMERAFDPSTGLALLRP